MSDRDGAPAWTRLDEAHANARLATEYLAAATRAMALGRHLAAQRPVTKLEKKSQAGVGGHDFERDKLNRAIMFARRALAALRELEATS